MPLIPAVRGGVVVPARNTRDTPADRDECPVAFTEISLPLLGIVGVAVHSPDRQLLRKLFGRDHADIVKGSGSGTR